MADTVRSVSYLLGSVFQDGQAAGAITPQDVRDLIVSLQPPMQGVYVTTPAATTISIAGTYVKGAGTTAVTNSMGDIDTGGASNRIRYTGAEPRHFHCVAQTSVDISGGTNQRIGIQVYHWDDSAGSGALVAHSEAIMTMANADTKQITTHADVMMDTNDYLEIWITNHSSASNSPTMTYAYLFAMGIIM